MTYKWDTPYEWFRDYVQDLPDDARWRELLLEFAEDLGNDAIQDKFQDQMDDDGYFDDEGDEDIPDPYDVGYDAGYADASNGIDRIFGIGEPKENPYAGGSEDAGNWDLGYDDGQNEYFVEQDSEDDRS